MGMSGTFDSSERYADRRHNTAGNSKVNSYYNEAIENDSKVAQVIFGANMMADVVSNFRS